MTTMTLVATQALEALEAGNTKRCISLLRAYLANDADRRAAARRIAERRALEADRKVTTKRATTGTLDAPRTKRVAAKRAGAR